MSGLSRYQHISPDTRPSADSACHQVEGPCPKIIQMVELVWHNPATTTPPIGTALWVVLENVTDDGSPGDRCLEFAEYSPNTYHEIGGWALIGGTPIGPDHKVVAWAHEPELPPRFDTAPVADTGSEARAAS